MPLINCPDCGYRISNNASLCPKCGNSLRRKKGIRLWMILLLVFAGLIYFVFALFKDNRDFEPISVSPELSDVGFSSTYMTSKILSEINNIIYTSNSESVGFALNKTQLWKNSKIPDFNVPQLGLSFDALLRLLRENLGIKHFTINSDASIKADSIILSIVISCPNTDLNKIDVIKVPLNSCDSLFIMAADFIMESLDPMTVIGYYSLRDKDKAFKMIKKHIIEEERYKITDYIILWGLILQESGKNEEAISKCKDILALANDNESKAIAYNNWGISLCDMGHKGEALEKFSKAVELDNNIIYLSNNLAVSYMDVKDYPKAQRLLHKVINKSPKFMYSYLSLAQCLLQMGDTLGAFNIYKKAEKNVNLSPEIYYYWASLLEIAHQKDEAIEKYTWAAYLDNVGKISSQANNKISQLSGH
jgi:Tfp pilus assembly protein PilF